MYYRKRKGLSPLVAAVLLIAFTMTVAALLTVWIKGFTDEQKAKAEESSRRMECSYINIEMRPEFSRFNLTYEGNTALFEAYVINNGLSDADITHVQIVDRYGKSTPPHPLEKIVTLKKDENKYIDLNITVLADELGLVEEEDLDKVILLTSCSGISSRVTRPFGGWNTLEKPLGEIIQVK
ncbi:MAG: hypothetical protein GXN99_02120 [Candidatus Nanohaloarchaeota archaeon]|nr:hypothetical protein [Candidatus Nanohaloarchaeota archaeon]